MLHRTDVVLHPVEALLLHLSEQLRGTLPSWPHDVSRAVSGESIEGEAVFPCAVESSKTNPRHSMYAMPTLGCLGIVFLVLWA